MDSVIGDGAVELTVISPAYNEEGGLRDSVTAQLEALNSLGQTYELILVNDGSTDGTARVAQQLADANSRVQLISYPANRGRGYALRRGVAASRGRFVITMESDNSYGTGIIKTLHDELCRSGADVVIASPYRKGGRLEAVPLKRALLSRLGNQILKVAVSPRITTVSGMTRGYVGSSIRALPLEEDGKEIHLEIVSKASAMGYAFSEVPATLSWTGRRQQVRRPASSFRAGHLIVSHLLFGFGEKPIMLFGTLGAALLSLGIISGARLFYLYVVAGQIVGHRTALILTTLFLLVSGMQIFLFSFLSHQNRELRKDVMKCRYEICRLTRGREADGDCWEEQADRPGVSAGGE